jgi:predicted sulfurtransferase
MEILDSHASGWEDDESLRRGHVAVSEEEKEWRIALYYCYVPIEDVPEHVEFQARLCGESLGLKGRIRVSPEGLNGVLSGTYDNLLEYQRTVEARLSDSLNGTPLDVKYCQLRPDVSPEQQLFESLSVKATLEVVSLYEPPPSTHQQRRRRGRKSKQNVKKPNTVQDKLPDLEHFEPAPHLSPEEWNDRLLPFASSTRNKSMLKQTSGTNGSYSDGETVHQNQGSDEEEAILVDARNVYESRVGYFSVPGVPTLLTNTRKYSSLPAVLEGAKKELAGKTIYMYCTGGVRCERASVHLQALMNSDEWTDPVTGESLAKPKGIYQLNGGIQKYLEKYGTNTNNVSQETLSEPSDSGKQTPEMENCPDICLFKGKNFVFDPRRTDPMVGRPPPTNDNSDTWVAGKCRLCSIPHDDYDNGHAPCENREGRCCRCRVLVLVCNDCRTKVRSWGEDKDSGSADPNANIEVFKPDLFCGGVECIDEGNKIEATILVE